MKKRIISSLLVILMLVSSTACSETIPEVETDSETNGISTDTTVDAETAVEYLDDLPDDLDFGDVSIRFLVDEAWGGNLSEVSVFVEEESADVVPAAVFKRNLQILDRIGAKIELVEVTDSTGFKGKVRSSVQAMSDDYDIVSAHQYNCISLAPEGMLMNLANMEYLDFSKEYWATDYIDNMGYLDVKPWATGDAALRYIGGMYCTFVNSEIWEDNFSGQSLYDIVLDGEWTLDKMKEFSEQVYVDKNGDGEADESDVFGLVESFEDPIDGFAAASMVEFSRNNDENIPEITIANDRTYAFYDKIFDLLVNNPGFFAANSDDNYTTMTMFRQSHSMFTVNKIFQAEFYLRDMEIDFMVIPVPKLDTFQANYNTRTHDGMSIYGIPITNSKLDATSATLEAMASESLRLVTPAYYETALKIKYTRDSESGQMIDLIRQNVNGDFASMYSGSISDIVHIFRRFLNNGQESIASSLAKAEKTFQVPLNNLLKKIQSADNQNHRLSRWFALPL